MSRLLCRYGEVEITVMWPVSSVTDDAGNTYTRVEDRNEPEQYWSKWRSSEPSALAALAFVFQQDDSAAVRYSLVLRSKKGTA